MSILIEYAASAPHPTAPASINTDNNDCETAFMTIPATLRRFLLCLACSTPLTALAQFNAGCTMQPPQAALQAKAYPGYKMERRKANRTIESAPLHDGMQVEIQQGQCVDFLVSAVTLVLPRQAHANASESELMELARGEIARLKTSAAAGKYDELQQFLAQAHGIPAQRGKRAACKDQSEAQPGQCSWESAGGFIVEVRYRPDTIRVTVTEYTSA